MCRRDRLLAQFGSKLSRERIVSERAGMKGLSCAKLLFVITVMMVLVVSLTYGADPTSTGRQTAIATFAGGCFWCMEPPYDEIDGVLSTISGYTGGTKKNPTYEQVTTGTTGHAEAVQIAYDPSKVSYEKLLEVFWRNIWLHGFFFLFFLIEAVDIAALVKFLDEAQVGKVFGLGRSCLGILFCQRS